MDDRARKALSGGRQKSSPLACSLPAFTRVFTSSAVSLA